MWHLVCVPQMLAPYILLCSVGKELHHATEKGGKCVSHGAAHTPHACWGRWLVDKRHCLYSSIHGKCQ